MDNIRILQEVVRISYASVQGIKQETVFEEPEILLTVAKQQNVYPLVLYGVSNIYKDINEYRQKIRCISANYFRRKLKTLQLIAELEASGIRTIVLKGYSCSRHYAVEVLRSSSDCDLLICPQQEKRTIEFFAKNGFVCIHERSWGGHHSVWKHKDIGVVELHVALYEEAVDLIWLNRPSTDKVFQNRVCVSSAEGEWYQLSAVDNILFLYVHAVKHFLQTGISIQILLDISIAYDLLSVDERTTVERIVGESKYGNMLSVWLDYISFYGRGDACVTDLHSLELLTNDLLSGGWLGLEKSNRRSRLDHLTEVSFSKKIRLRFKNFLYRVFATRSILESEYKYAKRYAFLIPVAWVHRVIRKGFVYLMPNRTRRIKNKKKRCERSERATMISEILENTKK